MVILFKQSHNTMTRLNLALWLNCLNPQHTARVNNIAKGEFACDWRKMSEEKLTERKIGKDLLISSPCYLRCYYVLAFNHYHKLYLLKRCRMYNIWVLLLDCVHIFYCWIQYFCKLHTIGKVNFCKRQKYGKKC